MHIYIQLAPFASTTQEEGKSRGERGRQQRKLGRSPLSCGYILCLINSLQAEHGVRQTLSIFIEFHSLRLNVCRFCQSCHTHTRAASPSPALPICIWRLGGLSLWPCIEACFKWFYRTRLIASCNQFAAASLRIRSVCQNCCHAQSASACTGGCAQEEEEEENKRKIYSYFN